MVATKKESEEKTREITKLTSELRTAEQEIKKLKAQPQSYTQTLQGSRLGRAQDSDGKGAGREAQGAGELRIEEISSAKLTSDRDLVNTEFSAVMETSPSSMTWCCQYQCCGRRSRRGVQLRLAVSESSRRLEKALSILSETALLQRLHRATIQQHEALSSNFASSKADIEFGVAKAASASADNVPLAGQIAASDSDLTAVNAVSAEQKLAQLEAKHAHQLVELQPCCCTQAWRAEELRHRLEAMQQEACTA